MKAHSGVLGKPKLLNTMITPQGAIVILQHGRITFLHNHHFINVLEYAVRAAVANMPHTMTPEAHARCADDGIIAILKVI